MSLVTILGKQMLLDLIGPGSRERRFDIEKLANYCMGAGSTGLAALLRSLAGDMDRRGGLSRTLERAGRCLSPASRKKVAANLAWNWAVEGARRQGMAGMKGFGTGATPGDGLPAVAALIPTLRCNLSCPGCSRVGVNCADLSLTEIDRQLLEAKQGGRFLVAVSGGEPLLCAEHLLAAARTHHEMFLLVYTNGTLVSPAFARRVAALGNVAMVFTMVGDRKATDARRGPDAYRRAAAGMRMLAKEGVLVGVAPRPAGARAQAFLTGDDFVRRMLRNGVLFALFPEACAGAEAITDRHPIFVRCTVAVGPFPAACTGEHVVPVTEGTTVSVRRSKRAKPFVPPGSPVAPSPTVVV